MSAQMTSYDTMAVEVSHVTKTFPVPRTWTEKLLRRSELALTAVNDVSFSIAPGETFSLVGESGCGKSTLARMVSGIYRPTAGSIRLFGIDTATAHAEVAADVRRRINMIFQDPYASLNPRMRIYDAVAEPLRVQHPDMSEDEVKDRVMTAVKLVRLPEEALTRFPHQFSGGQRQRICIARALTGRPEFLICDEPTSALDVSVQAQVLNLMRELQQEIGITYLFISHNLAVVHHMSRRVGVMYLGRLVETGDRESLFTDPLHPYTKMLMEAIPSIEEGVKRAPIPKGEVPSPMNPPAGCPFHPRCPYATARCREEVPSVVTVTGKNGPRTVACHLTAG